MDYQKLFKEGKILGFPTDTVYGVGALLSQKEAIAKIYALKGRDPKKPLVAHVSSIEMARSLLLSPPESFYTLAERFWPGALTLIANKALHIPDFITAGLPTIGVRVPDHPELIALIESLGEPIMGTSANISGKKEALCAESAKEIFGTCVAAYIPGKAKWDRPSTVYSVEEKRLYRVGIIPLQDLEKS